LTPIIKGTLVGGEKFRSWSGYSQRARKEPREYDSTANNHIWSFPVFVISVVC
jgi:hypothetical protein